MENSEMSELNLEEMMKIAGGRGEQRTAEVMFLYLIDGQKEQGNSVENTIEICKKFYKSLKVEDPDLTDEAVEAFVRKNW